jgi:hypothetical protein
MCLAISFPHVVTVHGGEIVQVFNVDTKQCDQFQQERGLIDGVRAVLANNKLIVGIAPKRLVVWDRELMTTQQARVVELAAAPSQISSISDFSALIGDSRVLVVNGNPGGHLFHVWDHVRGELCAYAENPSKTESFLAFDRHADGYVVGACRDVMYIWNTAGKPGLLPPAHMVRFDGAVVTALEVDQHLILAGDNFGGVTLHTRTGKLIYRLNRVKQGQGESADLGSVQLSQLSTLFKNKVGASCPPSPPHSSHFPSSRHAVLLLLDSNEILIGSSPFSLPPGTPHSKVPPWSVEHDMAVIAIPHHTETTIAVKHTARKLVIFMCTRHKIFRRARARSGRRYSFAFGSSSCAQTTTPSVWFILHGF